MYSSFMIFVAYFFAWFTIKRPRILYKEYFLENTLDHVSSWNKSPILDPEKDDVDYICCTYLFDGKMYKIIVKNGDVLDINSINLTKRDEIGDCFIEFQTENENRKLDVTDIIRQYAGPHQDFYEYERMYEKMFPFSIVNDEKLFLTMERNGSHLIVAL